MFWGSVGAMPTRNMWRVLDKSRFRKTPQQHVGNLHIDGSAPTDQLAGVGGEDTWHKSNLEPPIMRD